MKPTELELWNCQSGTNRERRYKGPDAGQELHQVWFACSAAELDRIGCFQKDVVMPGTPRVAVLRFLLLAGLDYLESEKKAAGAGK